MQHYLWMSTKTNTIKTDINMKKPAKKWYDFFFHTLHIIRYYVCLFEWPMPMFNVQASRLCLFTLFCVCLFGSVIALHSFVRLYLIYQYQVIHNNGSGKQIYFYLTHEYNQIYTFWSLENVRYSHKMVVTNDRPSEATIDRWTEKNVSTLNLNAAH